MHGELASYKLWFIAEGDYTLSLTWVFRFVLSFGQAL